MPMKHLTQMEAIDQFQQFMQDNGISPPSSIEADGEIHRYHIEGQKSGSKNGAYAFYLNPNGSYGGWVKDFKQGDSIFNWSSISKSDYNQLTAEEQQILKKQQECQAQQQQAERNRKQEQGKTNALWIWEQAEECTTHHYLESKGVQAVGLKTLPDPLTINTYSNGKKDYDRGSLLIPMYNNHGEMGSLQIISRSYSDNDPPFFKQYLKDGLKEGCYYKIGQSLTDVIYICEGWTTGKSLHDATGCLVVVAFDCGNLQQVAERIQAKVNSPGQTVVIACDNDQFKEKNRGIEAGQAINQQLGIPYTYPLFNSDDLKGKPTDFNDLHQLYGLEVVKQQLQTNLTTLDTLKNTPQTGQNGENPTPNHHPSRDSNPSETEQQEYLVPQTFPTLAEQGFYGVLGEFTHLATENSEASKEAVLMSTLTALSTFFGNVSAFELGDTWIEPRLFTVLAGMSSRARKGTSFKPVIRLIEVIQQLLNRKPSYKIPTQYKNGVYPAEEFQRISGLSSAEGMIFEVRDEVYKKTEVGEQLVDEGVDDKRLLIVEEELGRVFKMAQREGNTLSQTLRQAFDGDVISPMTKHNRIRATYPHINLLGHITRYELLKLTDESDVYNGWYNRFLWCCVRRSKLVPFPRRMDSDRLLPIASTFADAVYFAHQGQRLSFSPNAKKLWEATYYYISRKPVMNSRGDALTSRQESHLLRIAMILALLDQTKQVEEEHLMAAIAIGDYCNASVYYLFTAIDPDEDNNPDVQKIIATLKEQGKLTRTQIRDLFNRNKSKEQINIILTTLESAGHIVSDKVKGKSCKPTIYYKLSGIHE